MSPSTVERITRRRRLSLDRSYTAERNIHGGTWRIAGVVDYYAKHERELTASHHLDRSDAIVAVKLALAEVHA